MDAVTIKFKANGQQLTRVGSDKFAANTVSYIRGEFELGDNWDGFDSVRAIWATNFAKVATVLDGSGACVVPWEVLNRTGTLYVNLVGSISDGDELTDRLTTYKAKALDVNGRTNVDGDNTQPITPSQFEQFVEVAHDDAEAAADARDEASVYASNAEGYRDEAVGAAADAKDYRDAAKGYADDAEDYKDQAKGYADEAEADAEEIRNMSATATTLPAGSSATASYADGVLSLGIPKGDTGATGATGNGIASAVLNADYTLTLNFTDGTHYTTPPIRGAQGVQGATGNGIESVYLTGQSGAVKTYTILFTDGSTFDYQVTDGEVTNAVLEQVLPTDSANGSIASFPDGSDLFDYLSCIVNIEPIQDLHGYDKPWVGGSHYNQWDEQWEQGVIAWNGSVSDDGSARIRSKNFVPCVAGNEYRVVTSANLQFFYYDSSKAFVSYEPSSKTSGSSITIPTGCSYLKFYTHPTSYGATYKNDIAINYPSTVTTYSPWENLCPITGWTGCNVVVSPTQDAQDGTTYPVSWQTEAGTVYGGTVDLVTGVLTVTPATADMGTLNWVYVSGGNYFYAVISDKAKGFNNIKCSAYEVAPKAGVANLQNGQIVGGMNDTAVYVKDSRYTDAVSFKAGVSGYQLVYELATPTTYQLDPVQVACLLGHNNVWADCGDIEEVKYKADVQLWVEKMLNA